MHELFRVLFDAAVLPLAAFCFLFLKKHCMFRRDDGWRRHDAMGIPGRTMVH